MNDPNIDAVLRYIQLPPRSPQTMRKIDTELGIFSSLILGIWLLIGVLSISEWRKNVAFFPITIVLILVCISFIAVEHRAEQKRRELYKEFHHRIRRMTNAEKKHIAEDFAASRALSNLSMRLGQEYLYVHRSNLLLPLSSVMEFYEERDFHVNDEGPDDYWIEIHLVTKLSDHPIRVYRSKNCPSRKEADAHRRLCVLQQQPELAHVSFRKRS